jgi:hypothetical protein
MTTPNLGALYRFRFPFYMSLVGMGLWSWIVLAGRFVPGPAAGKNAGKPVPK